MVVSGTRARLALRAGPERGGDFRPVETH